MVSNKSPIVAGIGISPTNVSKNSPNANLASTFVKRGTIPKPQVQFKDNVDNTSLPFVPKIRQKPNALKPLPSIFTFKL